MKGTRPTPQSYYYSGQGRVLLGTRDAVTGEGFNLRAMGNCTSLTFEVTSEKYEHKEQMTGQRAVDLVIPKEKTAIMKMTCESLDLNNLALGLFGEVLDIAAGDVVDEPHKFVSGGIIPLKEGGVSNVVVKTGATAGAATEVDETAYHVDTDFGTIYPLDNSAFTGNMVFVSYDHVKAQRLDIFTKTMPEEKFLRFEGMNTVNEDICLINAPRVSFDPLPATALINEELGSVEFTANVLLDPTILTGSKFFTERIIKRADIAA